MKRLSQSGIKMPNAEMLLALRSPTSGWLAAVVCALDEAMLDPAFDDTQREVLRDLLEKPRVPNAVALAAHASLLNFESSMQASVAPPAERVTDESNAQRRKLTLAVSNSSK